MEKMEVWIPLGENPVSAPGHKKNPIYFHEVNKQVLLNKKIGTHVLLCDVYSAAKCGAI